MGPQGAVSTQQTRWHVPPNLSIQNAPQTRQRAAPWSRKLLRSRVPPPAPARQPRAGAPRPHLPGARTLAPAAPAGRAGRGRSRRRGAARWPPGIARRPAARPPAAPPRRPWPRPAHRAVPAAGPGESRPTRTPPVAPGPRLHASAPHWPRVPAMGGASGTGRAGLRRADSRSFTCSCLFPPGAGERMPGPSLLSLRRASPRSTELPAPRVLRSPCLRPAGRPAKEAADCIFCSASSRPSPRTAPGPSSSRLRGPSLSAAGSGVRGRAFAGTSPAALPEERVLAVLRMRLSKGRRG